MAVTSIATTPNSFDSIPKQHYRHSPQIMSPRLSPTPQYPDAPDQDMKYLPSAEKGPSNKVSTPLAAAAHAIATSANNNTSAPPTTNGKPSTTVTAPAVSMEEEPLSGRPVVDPGLPGVSDASQNRAYTFPPPLNSEDPHTPGNSSRNYSLPGITPKSSGSIGKKHKCPYCKTEFTRHHNLKSHLLTHSQEKPYECQQCQARFRRLHDLKRHTKLHTGERPHECPTCNRRFARGDALARHAKGPGGCAGRRGSFIDESPSGQQGDMSMEGVEYTAEPESMDDRASIDAKSSRNDSYRPATYPGILPPGGIPSIYSSGGPRSRDHSISSATGNSLAPIQQFNQNTGVFHQGVTESPKPISPNTSGDSRGPRSLTGTSPILPPPQSSAHLPSLPPIGSATNSLSSGSAGSTRDLATAELLTRVRSLENKLGQTNTEHDATLARLRHEHAKAMADQRREMDELREELARLRQERLADRISHDK